MLADIWAAAGTVDAQEINISELKSDLEVKEWELDVPKTKAKRKTKPKYGSAADFLKNSDRPEWTSHKKRCSKVNFDFPIVACKYEGDDNLHVLDGLHRLCCAIQLGKQTLQVKVLPSASVEKLLALQEEQEEQKQKKQKPKKQTKKQKR
jgi:hypothetical protein